MQIEQQNTSDEKEYGLRLVTPFALVDPVDQATWGPTKTSITTVTRSGNAIYIMQYFTFSQAELDQLTDLNATLAWEFRRPDVDEMTGIEITGSNVDYVDYWRSVNNVCIKGYYATNLENHSDTFTEESNLISGCPNVAGNKNEEFEIYIDNPSELIAEKLYYITAKFYIHDEYLNNSFQFYISKVEYCVLYFNLAYFCNVTGGKKEC